MESQVTQMPSQEQKTAPSPEDKAIAPVRSDPAGLVMQVIDVSYDGKRSRSPLQLNDDINGIEAALQNLPPHKDGIARVFDLYPRGKCRDHNGWQSNVSKHFREEYPGLRITPRLFPESRIKNDLWNISRQWAGNAEGTGISTKTSLKVDGKDSLNTASSFLVCYYYGINKLLVIVINEQHLLVGTAPPEYTYFDRIAPENRFIAMANGSRDRLTKLLVLDFLSSSVYLSPATQLELWRNPGSFFDLPTWEHSAVIAGVSSITANTVEVYIDSLALREVVLQELQELAEAIDFVVESLRKYSNPKEKAFATQQRDSSSSNAVDERMFILQQMCYQRRKNVERSIEQLNRTFEAKSKALNIQESASVRRLTILATIFLPLSLSTSILSMQSRFKELHLKLYDLVGVFVIIGTVAVIILLLVRAITDIASSAIFRDLSNPNRIWARHEKSIWGLLSVLGRIWFASTWAVLMVSFLFGMLKDVMLGVKILGFGFVGLLGYAILVCVVILHRIYLQLGK
ncbi:hypothetical protein CLAIMM_05968 [Cladophialophora immunda]|nr:hypothetical protein CLAIMM_05968 [Cladophialophora immunda]